MIETLADKISYYLVVMGISKEEEQEIISYGLFLILSDIMQITILLILSLFLNIFFPMIIYLSFFGSLKQFIGGFHADKHYKCLLSFTLIALMETYLCYLLSLNVSIEVIGNISLLLITFMMTVVIKFAPKPHPNNPKNTEKIKEFRMKALVIALIQFMLIALARYLMIFTNLFVYGSIASFTASLSLMIPIKGGETDENYI